jgi:60 kDa SS-A/Ro ribonucleoprotein
MAQWNRLKARNPGAKLICIDIQPGTTPQAQSRPDILNVGGFSDAMFDVVARFANGETRDWVSIINKMKV